MDLDALLRQLSHRMGDRPRDPVSRVHEPADPALDGERSITPGRLRMRLRGAVLDPGRRGARALAVAALLALAATAIWVIVDEPIGGTAPLGQDGAVRASAAAPGESAAVGGTGESAPAGGTGRADEASADSQAPPSVGPSAATLLVHVAGLVASPGLYSLPDGARVADALDAAGGALSGADLSTVNLARRVSDGEQIAIGVPGAADSSGRTSAQSTSGASGATRPIDINSADAAALDALPGIGPVLAQRIVDWRAEHGRFATIDQLREVPGIGSTTFERLASLVRV